jgi:hypothetical protein
MARKNEIAPSTNGDNGLQARDEKGRFLQGNPGGPGNPHAAAVGAWRAALVNAVTADDVRKVIGILTDKAKGGEAWAVKELLDRCLGRPQQKMELEATGEATWAMMLGCLQTTPANDKGGKK